MMKEYVATAGESVFVVLYDIYEKLKYGGKLKISFNSINVHGAFVIEAVREYGVTNFIVTSDESPHLTLYISGVLDYLQHAGAFGIENQRIYAVSVVEVK
jgi:adenine deaminase